MIGIQYMLIFTWRIPTILVGIPNRSTKLILSQSITASIHSDMPIKMQGMSNVASSISFSKNEDVN